MTRSLYAPTVGLALVAATLLPPAVEAGKIIVATDGTDSPSCGAKADPCRSISRAIQNAGPGDTIIVGPGRYGELTGDTDFSDFGEENAAVDVGCDCVVAVTKPLTVISRDGAAVTIIDAGQVNAAAVAIAASGVRFGKAKHGFTLLGSGEHGLEVTASDVEVVGNRMVGNDLQGIFLRADRIRVRSNEMIANGSSGLDADGEDLVIIGNRAVGHSGAGFFGQSGASRGLLRNNLAVDNGTGFTIGGTDWTITGNVASGGGNGFFFNPQAARATLVGNVASGNRGSGFSFQGPDHVLRKNSAIGNGRYGIVTLSSASGVVIDATNIVGNSGTFDFPGCGILNASSFAVTATGNYWGAPDGPGPEPADSVCTQSGTVVVEPFAEKEIKVAPKVAP